MTPFGQYQLLDRLAVGGMAELFLAVRVGEAGFQKACVVKRVLPYLAESPEFVQMFLDEARIAARLDHPGVVQVFELGKHEAAYFIAMEYLAGSDLVGLVRRAQELGQPLPAPVVAKVIAQAAEALDYVHQLKDEKGQPLGIVHRDVSPSNLFVTCQGAVKVLDFGVAFAREREQRTETGHVKGKAGYMSPEQCLGHTVDRRTDVWALGVVAYELLSGQRLFDGKTTAQSALAVCQKPIPPLQSVRPELPPALCAVVMRALERDLDARWASGQALQGALESSMPDLADSKELAEFVKTLFGVEWVDAQLARTFAPKAQARAGGTEALQESTEAPTQVGSGIGTVQERALRSPRRRWPLVVAGVAAVGAVAAFFAWPESPVVVVDPPPPVVAKVEPPPPVPVPTPVVAEPVIEKPKPTRTPPVVRPKVEKPRSQATGRVSLVTQPYARVSFKGRALGPTPLFDVELPVGKQTLVLVGEDGISRALDVSVQESSATQLRLKLDQVPKR